VSHWLGFYVLPFDWRLTSQAEIQLPINIDDFAQHLQAVYPAGEVRVVTVEGSTAVRLYITTEQLEPWVVGNLSQGKNTILDISAWPKPLAVRLILWYREYVSLKYPLFLVISDTGEGIELTGITSAQDIENLYPPQWVLKEWRGS
jgi:hypothetical protein